MAWIDDLYSRLTDFRQTTGVKLNWLYDNKEDRVNKKTNLLSADPAHYPNVPAVREGINIAIDEAISTLNLDLDTRYIKIEEKGIPGGVATLDSTGKVPTEQLPGFVDDVIDLVNIVTANPTTGMIVGQKWYNETTKKIFTATSATTGNSTDPVGDVIYVNTNNNTTWRWTGTTMIQLNGGLVLGTTSTTAYRGDHGLIAYTHSQTQGNPHNTQISDIPNLVNTLSGKANIRLDNIPSDLTGTEQQSIRTKLGVGTGNGTLQTVAISMPNSFQVSNSPLTGTGGTITITLATGYTIPTTSKQSQWDTAYSWGDHSGLYAPLSHTHNSGQITLLTGYTLGTNVAIAATDSLNAALGKIQAQLNAKPNTMPTVGNGNIEYVGAGSITGGGTSTANQSGNTSYSFDLTQATKDNITLGVTAYNWGDHATQGYVKTDTVTKVGTTAANATSGDIILAASGSITAVKSGNTITFTGTNTVYAGSTSIILVSGAFQRAALTGDVTASQNSNATTIAVNAVTFAKMQNIASKRLLGRAATGTGSVQEITLGAGITLTDAGVLSATGLGGTVTSVGVSVPVGFAVGNTPVTSAGTIAITFATGYSLPTNVKQGQWDTAYQHSLAMGNATQPIPDWSAQLIAQLNF